MKAYKLYNSLNKKWHADLFKDFQPRNFIDLKWLMAVENTVLSPMDS